MKVLNRVIKHTFFYARIPAFCSEWSLFRQPQFV